MIGLWSCRRFRRSLWNDIDGLLPAAGKARLQSHLQTCPSCRVLADQARRIDRILMHEPPVEPPDEFEERVILGIAAGMGLAGAARRGPAAGTDDPAGKGDPMGAWEWWILGGFLVFGVAVVGWLLMAIVPALLTPTTPAAQGARPGALDVLTRSLDASGASVQSVTSILQSPLGGPILVLAGVLAFSLGIVRLALSRPSGGSRVHGRL